MPVNFPSSPTLNQTYSEAGRTWKWNGSAWEVVRTYLNYPTVSTSQPTGGSNGDVWLVLY